MKSLNIWRNLSLPPYFLDITETYGRYNVNSQVLEQFGPNAIDKSYTYHTSTEWDNRVLGDAIAHYTRLSLKSRSFQI